ncbi:MAG: EthD family reductase [Kutzneria sp.]|nr:EthD family reductase [Kutzneria sp.]
MYRLTILYGHPSDPDEFDRYYRDVHLPLARAMTGLSGWKLTWLRADRDGNPPPYHLMVDLYAEDRAAMYAVLDSQAARAATADVANFATGGVTYLFGDDETIIPVT